MRTRVAAMVAMVMVVPAAPALANNGTHGLYNRGYKSFDGPDKNQGGGQEHPKH